MSKKKIKKFFKIVDKLVDLNIREKKLYSEKADIFMSRFDSNCSLHNDANGVFNVFLNNPSQKFEKEQIINLVKHTWSETSMEENFDKIIDILLFEEFIVTSGNYVYNTNPKYVDIININKEKEIKKNINLKVFNQ